MEAGKWTRRPQGGTKAALKVWLESFVRSPLTLAADQMHEEVGAAVWKLNI